MENKAPKKITIEKDDIGHFHVSSNESTRAMELYQKYPYILESEHNRIVEGMSTNFEVFHKVSQEKETELKKHLQILLASMDGELDNKRMEYGESYPESECSIKAKQFLKSIK